MPQSEVVRSEHGQVVSGVLGPHGRAGNPLTRVKRRMDKRIEQVIEENGSVEEFAQAAAKALANPKADPALTREVLARLWPVPPRDLTVEFHGDQLRAEETSQTLLDGLASQFGSEVPRDARLVGEGAAVEAGPDEGAP